MRKTARQEERFLPHLESLAQKLGIKIRQEDTGFGDISGPGGLCRLKGDYLLIIHPLASAEEKVRLLVRAIKRFPWREMYIRPAVRELLEKEWAEDNEDETP